VLIKYGPMNKTSGGTGSGGGRCDVGSGNREGDVEESNSGVYGISVVRTGGNSGFVRVANDGAASAWALVSELAKMSVST
jgi:hypothetical protein